MVIVSLETKKCTKGVSRLSNFMLPGDVSWNCCRSITMKQVHLLIGDCAYLKYIASSIVNEAIP